jgi:xanthine dehydrogenase accessory factor
MNSWLKHLRTAIALNNGFVLITIIATKGSTPCSHGDKIVYTDNEVIFGSIGGGNLEYKALSTAKEMLNLNDNSNQLIKYPLGATLGQCCGGYVKVLFESFVGNYSSLKGEDSWVEKVSRYYIESEDFILATSIDNDKDSKLDKQKFLLKQNDFYSSSEDKQLSNFVKDHSLKLLQNSQCSTLIEFENESGSGSTICLEKVVFSELLPVAIFGAGHISRALMPILINLPIKLFWIDDRQEQFDKFQGDTSQIKIICDDMVEITSDLPDNVYCLVITYSHQIDFEVCEKMIIQNNFSYLGMIGSSIKGNKFRDRFKQKNYSEEVINKFTCPIGEKHKFLKSPTAIAVTIAMDLMNFIEHKKQIEAL